jgi:hypothetical protein
MYNDVRDQWSSEDEAECNRLATEMQEDARWQIQLFTFAVTATAVILGVIGKIDSNVGDVIPAGLAFLSPLIVLIPTTLMILNRARTRNRKAAFMFSVLDCKRLRVSGVQHGDAFEEVKQRDDLPWETALHIIDRFDDKAGPHLAPALRYMTICSFLMELLCMGLAFWSLRQADPRVLLAVGAAALASLLLLSMRWRALAHLKGSKSIQGYAMGWLESRNPNEVPRYLKEWVEVHKKFMPAPPKPMF